MDCKKQKLRIQLNSLDGDSDISPSKKFGGSSLACVVETDSNQCSPNRRAESLLVLSKESSNDDDSQIEKYKQFSASETFDDSLKILQRKSLLSIGGSANNKKKSLNQLVTFEVPKIERKLTASQNRLTLQNRCKDSLVITRPRLSGVVQQLQSATTEGGETRLTYMNGGGPQSIISDKSFSVKSSSRSHNANKQFQALGSPDSQAPNRNLENDQFSSEIDEEDIKNQRDLERDFKNDLPLNVPLFNEDNDTILIKGNHNSDNNINQKRYGSYRNLQLAGNLEKCKGLLLDTNILLTKNLKVDVHHNTNITPNRDGHQGNLFLQHQHTQMSTSTFKKSNLLTDNEVDNGIKRMQTEVRTGTKAKICIQIEELVQPSEKEKDDDDQGFQQDEDFDDNQCNILLRTEFEVKLDDTLSNNNISRRGSALVNHITDLRKESDSSCSNDSKNKLRQIVEDHKPLDNMPEALAFEDQYEICEYLGEGCSSVVKICKLIHPPHTKYAVKIMRVPDQELYQIAMREFELLDGLGQGHPNIMKVEDIFYNTNREQMYIVLEYAGKGFDLTHLIKNMASQKDGDDQAAQSSLKHKNDEKTIKHIIKKLLEGINFIHENQICHRDVKPGNIYVTEDLETLKIIDFNAALRFKHEPKSEKYEPTLFGVTGEEQFSCPELSSGQYYSENVDCWSAGVVMFLLMTKGEKKVKFFPYDDPEEIQEQIDNKIAKLDKYGEWSLEMKQLLRKFLEVDPKQRINAAQALSHQWFKQ
eukprot:403332102